MLKLFELMRMSVFDILVTEELFVLRLELLRLILNKKFKVILVVQDLLEVLLH